MGNNNAIHAFAIACIEPKKVMDHRVKPGDDDEERSPT
jgi:hypothetical protein